MKALSLSGIALALAATFGLTANTVLAGDSGCEYGNKAAKADIVDTAVSAGTFNTLVAAVQAADLVDTLKSEGPFTVMAPTDEAFAKLPEGTVETLLKPENKDQLVAILTYHVIPAKAKAEDALKMGEAPTVQGGTLGFAVVDGQAQVNGINIVATDIKTSNGIIHVIDQVLLPESAE
ncbi:fasciclin domain-containing protein [Algisphaera agarilytica]|uniref:Putative surface protein with fasciclin (FAS1) repeats n=1 Tax=Algisphaera agarilytica TaxID=1385975 RepID=A0A7X0H5G3_9BACT|nr:fasciclin domain-containing protein [Algisphaera agarilytica]MBB6429412.1 putative surface protein with fasciclin (FAS1) repeats [Algisphaera agarilytica]